MRVLHVIPSVSLKRGGPSFMIRDMGQGLARIGVSVDIATTDDDGDRRVTIAEDQPVESDGYRIWQFSSQTTFYRASLPLTRWLAQHVTDYDVVHIHSLWSFPAIPAAYFAHRKRVPYIISPHGAFSRWGMENRRPFTKQLSYRAVEGRIVRNASLVHYTAEQERIEAGDLGIDSPSRIVPLGIDLSEFEGAMAAGPILQRYPALDGRVVVLFLSRIDRKKGLDLLLPAFADVLKRYPQAILLIVGDGETELVRAYKGTAEKAGIAGDVIWAGFLSGEEKSAAFAAGDVYVLPSYTENFGIVVVEAMASCLPLVISDEVAIAPEIERAGAGIVIDLDPRSLTDAIDELVSDPQKRQEMGQRGRKLATELFSQEAMAGNLLQMYEDVVEGRAVSGRVGDRKRDEAAS